MFNTKYLKLIITILIIITFSSVFSKNEINLNSIKTFQWSNNLVYLPTIFQELEIYNYKQGRLKHKYTNNKKWYLKLNFKYLFISKNKDEVLKSVKYLLENQNNDIFKIILSKYDKDSLAVMSKKKTYWGAPLYLANYDDLNKYIKNNDTLIIEIKEFNTAYSKASDSMSVVIYGAPFEINLKVQYNNTEIREFKYIGNLCDGVEDTSVDEFLIYYKISENFNLFHRTPMNEYFCKKNLYRIILRYIAYKEKKLDRYFENFYR